MKKLLFILVLLFLSLSQFAQDKQLEAKACFFTAVEEYESGNYSTCIKELNQAISLLGSTNPKIQYYKILANYKRKKFIETQKQINIYLKLNPKEDEAYKEILVIYRRIKSALQKQLAEEKETIRRTKEKYLAEKRKKQARIKKYNKYNSKLNYYKALHNACKKGDTLLIKRVLKEARDQSYYLNIHYTFDAGAKPEKNMNWSKGWYHKVGKFSRPPMYWTQLGNFNFMNFIFRNYGYDFVKLQWYWTHNANVLMTTILQGKPKKTGYSNWSDNKIYSVLKYYLRLGAKGGLAKEYLLYWTNAFGLKKSNKLLLDYGYKYTYNEHTFYNKKYGRRFKYNYFSGVYDVSDKIKDPYFSNIALHRNKPVINYLKRYKNNLSKVYEPYSSFIITNKFIKKYKKKTYSSKYRKYIQYRKFYSCLLPAAIVYQNKEMIKYLIKNMSLETLNKQFLANESTFYYSNKRYMTTSLSTLTPVQLALIYNDIETFKLLMEKGVSKKGGAANFWFLNIDTKKTMYYKSNRKLAKDYCSPELFKLYKKS